MTFEVADHRDVCEMVILSKIRKRYPIPHKYSHTTDSLVFNRFAGNPLRYSFRGQGRHFRPF